MANVPQLRLYKDETLNSSHQEKLNELYNLFKDDNPKWIVRQECLNLKSVDNLIFVFNVFEGAAFEHVKNLKGRIVSAFCMLNSFKQNKKIPRSQIPIFSSSMLDLNICCSNMEKKLREEIYFKVEMMRGKTSKIFTEKVTHLVTTEVGSNKYHAAGSMKIPVMLADWVQEVWKVSENEDVHGTDAKFLKNKCPIFYKLVICASGFSEEIKNKIKSLVESEGGTYRGDLVCGTTTHLVLNEAKGAKYEHAKLWKIHVLKSEWIYESIKQGYCLPEKDFILETDNQTSTPTESRVLSKKCKVPDIDISSINPNNFTKCVNETENNARGSNTLSQTALNQSSSILNKTSNVPSSSSKPMSNYSDLLKELNLIGKIKLTLFDGIGIYCETFDPVINEKLKKICNLGGAIRFDEYNSDVTHVIINQVNEKQCKSYIELNPEVNVVTIDWLINSCKQNQLEDCKNYCAFKNALNSVKTPKKRSRPEKPSQSISINNNKTFDSDLNDCLSQYLNAEAALMKPPAQPSAQTNRPFQSTNSLSSKLQQYQEQKKFDTPPEAPIQTPKQNLNSTLNNVKFKPDLDPNDLFYKKRIQVIGFDEEERESIEKFLLQKSALILPSYDLDQTEIPSSRKVENVDYTIFPLVTSMPILNNNPATVYWMKKCIEINKLLDLTEDVFYQPIPRYNQDLPLTNCVITISGFGQYEKDNIANLCKLLGAHIQQSLSLKKTNETEANTHLICKQAIGPKYIAAKTWNLPCICAEWVVECCVMGMKADERKYSIENQELIQKDLIEALSKIRKQTDDICTNSSYNSKSNNTPSRSILASNRQDQTISDYVNHNDSSLTYHNESKKPRLDPNDCEMENENNEQEETRQLELRRTNLNTTDSELVLAAIENSAKFKKPSETPLNNSIINSNQVFTTPCNPRLKELRRTEQLQPISPSTLENNNNTKFSTPIWMKPESSKTGYEFKFKGLDCDRALEMLKTPEAFNNKLKTKKNDTPLCELFTNAIHIASEKSKNPEYWDNCYNNNSPVFEYSFQRKKKENENGLNKFNNEDIGDQTEMDEHIQPTPAHLKILKNIKVYVCRKLVKSQAELYKIVEQLGGDFSWTYNQDVTHFIYSGEISDSVKELKVARDDNKIIVSPDWIYACQEQNAYVNENMFLLSRPDLQENNHQLDLQPENLNSIDQQDEVFQSNESNQHEEQFDIKREFLDQLQNKLASLKTNSSINTKKIGRNKSDINKSELDNENRSTNYDDETALMQNYEFNDINNKNDDLTDNLDDDDEEESFKRKQFNLKRKANIQSAVSMESLDDKSCKNVLKQIKVNDDFESTSPSILNKDSKSTKKFNSNQIAPSQIQVTYWKEDTNPQNLVPTQANNSRATRPSQRFDSTKTDKIRTSKADAIAERIMTAARIVNSKKS